MDVLRSLVFLLGILFSTAIGQQLPRITGISQPIFVKKGENISMYCMAEDIGNNKVVWIHIKDGVNRILTHGADKLTGDPAVSVSQEGDNKFILDVRNVDERDGGLYQCQITSERIVSENVEVFILTMPVINEISMADNGSISEGGEVRLYCNATGSPKPDITWRRKNDEILPMGTREYSGDEMLITNINRNDRGAYTCTATNDVGSDTTEISVVVNFVPEVLTPRPRSPASQGSSAELECLFVGHPSLAITWFNEHGEDVTDFGVYKTTNTPSDVNMDELRSMIVISKVNQHHYGKYRCNAKNEVGEIDGFIELYEVTSGSSMVSLSLVLSFLIVMVTSLLIS